MRDLKITAFYNSLLKDYTYTFNFIFTFHINILSYQYTCVLNICSKQQQLTIKRNQKTLLLKKVNITSKKVAFRCQK